MKEESAGRRRLDSLVGDQGFGQDLPRLFWGGGEAGRSFRAPTSRLFPRRRVGMINVIAVEGEIYELSWHHRQCGLCGKIVDGHGRRRG